MTGKTTEIVDMYDELERTLYWCIPEDNAAIKTECGDWIVEIVPKDRKNYTLRRALDLAAQQLELRYLLDKLKDLDGMREFNDICYNGGWWCVAIRHKYEPDKKRKRPDEIAEWYSKFYGMNKLWCNLTLQSETARLTIEGAEKGERSKTLVVQDPQGEMWGEAEELVVGGRDYQGTVTGDFNRKVKYDLRPVKSWIKQPSVTVRKDNIITHHEGRAVQVTEMPAMTVITLWKEIEYK